MNANSSPKDPAGKDQPTSRAKTVRPQRTSPSASGTAQRRAAVILEVLAGVRTVAEAAQTLGICANHYYLLERKALAGLVAACEPQPKGKQPDPKKELTALRQALERSERECQRQAALVRATQRALNLPAPPTDRTASAAARRTKNGKPLRKRKKSVRALRAAQQLAGAAGAQPDVTMQEPGPEPHDNAMSCKQERPNDP